MNCCDIGQTIHTVQHSFIRMKGKNKYQAYAPFEKELYKATLKESNINSSIFNSL